MLSLRAGAKRPLLLPITVTNFRFCTERKIWSPPRGFRECAKRTSLGFIGLVFLGEKDDLIVSKQADKIAFGDLYSLLSHNVAAFGLATVLGKHGTVY